MGDPLGRAQRPANTARPVEWAFLQPSSNAPSTEGTNLVVIQGSNVGILVDDGDTASFNSLLTELQSAGMQVMVSSAQSGAIVGVLPIAQLPAVAAPPQTPSITPQFHPSLA